MWRGCITGFRESWLLALLSVVTFLPPKNVPRLKCGAGVVRKTHGFRTGSCGICSEERAASVVERAASRSKLFRRMFRGWMSSTSLIWRALMLVLLLEGPWELALRLSVEKQTSQCARLCLPL